MLGISLITVQYLRFPTVAQSFPSNQGQTNHVYLPLIVRGIREIDVACRWAHQPAITNLCYLQMG